MVNQKTRVKRHAVLLSVLVCSIGVLLLLLVILSSVIAATNAPQANAVVSGNFAADRWRVFASMQKGRGDPGVVVFNDKIHVSSGFFSPGYGYVDSLEIYDPTTDSWKIRYGVPVPRSDLMAAFIGDKIYNERADI